MLPLTIKLPVVILLPLVIKLPVEILLPLVNKLPVKVVLPLTLKAGALLPVIFTEPDISVEPVGGNCP